MSKFKDIGQSDIMHSLIQNNEFKFFKTKMEIMHASFDILFKFENKNPWVHPLLHILIHNNQFHEYIKQKYSKQYEQILLDFFPKLGNMYDKGYQYLFDSVTRAL